MSKQLFARRNRQRKEFTRCRHAARDARDLLQRSERFGPERACSGGGRVFVPRGTGSAQQAEPECATLSSAASLKLTCLAFLDVLYHALLAFRRLRFPGVLVLKEVVLLPHVGRVTHVDDEHFAAV